MPTKFSVIMSDSSVETPIHFDDPLSESIDLLNVEKTIRVIIHIGGGKTGTTSIQRYLPTIKSQLEDEDVLYPAAAGGEAGIGHDVFGKAFIDNPPFYMKPPHNIQAALDAMASEIKATTASTVLISSEQFALANPVKVRAFFEALNRPMSFRILYFVRSQEELAESEYNQLVKLQRYHGSFAEYVDEHFDGNFHRIACAWRSAFGEQSISCHVYDAKKGHAIANLFAAAGLTPPEARERTINTALGFVALAVVRMISRNKKVGMSKLINQIIEEIGADDIPALFMDAAEASQFRSRFWHSNEALGREFMGMATAELTGRRYTDAERDDIRENIKALGLTGGLDIPRTAE